MAAYPLARRQTKLNKYVYFIFIAVMVIPPLTALVPLYKMVVNMGMMNTYQIAILNNVAAFLPLTIFYMRASFAPLFLKSSRKQQESTGPAR